MGPPMVFPCGPHNVWLGLVEIPCGPYNHWPKEGHFQPMTTKLTVN